MVVGITSKVKRPIDNKIKLEINKVFDGIYLLVLALKITSVIKKAMVRKNNIKNKNNGCSFNGLFPKIRTLVAQNVPNPYIP